jgi:hypothetical protein
MTQIVHKTRQHNTFLLSHCEFSFIHLREFRYWLVLFLEIVHHFTTKVSSTNAVLESVVSGTREYIVVGAKLVQVFESLHGRTINKHPGVLRQINVSVNYVVNTDLLSEVGRLFKL